MLLALLLQIIGPPTNPQLILPEVVARTVYVGPKIICPDIINRSNYIQQISGNGTLEVVGGQLFLYTNGRYQIHCNPDNPPQYGIRNTRDDTGTSINGSRMENIYYTGNAVIAQDINDCAEGSIRYNTHYDQRQVDGSCVLFSNINRAGSKIPVDKRTNSWHTITNCSGAVWAKPTKTDKSMGGIIRDVGCVREQKIVDGWWSGYSPLLVMVDMADESGTDSEGKPWGRANCPLEIIVGDNYFESSESMRIMLFDTDSYKTIDMVKNEYQTIYKLKSNGQSVLTLEGKGRQCTVYLDNVALPK